MTPAKKSSQKAESPVVPVETFGQRLYTARLRLSADQGRAFSQIEFAATVGGLLGEPFHQTRLSRLEANNSRPTLAEIVAIAEASGQSVLWLAFGFSGTETSAERQQWLAAYREAHQPVKRPTAAKKAASKPARKATAKRKR